jgi:hypothetical protein
VIDLHIAPAIACFLGRCNDALTGPATLAKLTHAGGVRNVKKGRAMAPLLLVLLLLTTFARAWIHMASAEAEMRRYYLLDHDWAQSLGSLGHDRWSRRAIGADSWARGTAAGALRTERSHVAFHS